MVCCTRSAQLKTVEGLGGAKAMAYWLDLFTPYTWERFQKYGATVSGFRPRQRRAAFERVQQGDLLVCYLVKLSRWCGVLEVNSAAYEDQTPIFADENDPFPIRFKVTPRVMLGFEHSIPIEELWAQLSFTKDLVQGSVGWAQAAKLRQSLLRISDGDGKTIETALQQQSQKKHVFALDAADLKRIAQRTVVLTEQGEVAVEVPDREEDQAATIPQGEVRASLMMQSKLARLGMIFGFSVWVPPSDRAKISELLSAEDRPKLVSALPLNFNYATLKTIENIDVIWLRRHAIARAFEVEHTTAIYSGLLRMADLLAMQPTTNFSLHIVAPIERRDQVRRETVRPVFSYLEGGQMAERCSYLTYDAIDEILAEPNLAHMRETIIDDYEEYFDAV
jgi:EVE domain